MTSLPSWLLPALSGAIVALLLGIFSYLVVLSSKLSAVQSSHEGMCQAHVAILNRVPDIEKQLDRLTYRQELSDEIMVKQAAAAIHSPTHVERDTLVDKLQRKTISCPELMELVWRLELLLCEETDSVKRLWASMLLVLCQDLLHAHASDCSQPEGAEECAQSKT